jgi:hypothetical protein
VKPDSANEIPERNEKRIHVALPVRVTYFDEENKPRFEVACTYDISPHGARVTGLRCVKEAGEIVVVERGRNKAFCRVVWIGEAGTPQQQQAGIQCVEAHKALWDAEMRDMQEMYDPMVRDGILYRAARGNAPDRTRRKYRRFEVEGGAELLRKGADASYLEGTVKDLSEVGCLVTTKTLLMPGTDLKLVLRLANYDLSFKGMVRHAALDVGLGIEFREIRKGDRAVLQHLLKKLAEKEREDTKSMAARAAAR